jgi:Zn-finger nucleic acid-binding protein
MDCVSCGKLMVSDTLEARFGASVAIDYCPACQSFWFDAHEDLQISSGSTLKLFAIVGQQTGISRPASREGSKCPRCSSHLVQTHDMQRNTRFEYWRCPHGHGRLVSFYDFLREKDFIRPLTPHQLAEMKENIQPVNCSNCGAPIDLTRGSTCAHCGSPLTMLDLRHPEELIAELRKAGRPHDAEVEPPSHVKTDGPAGNAPAGAAPSNLQAERSNPDDY